MQTPIHIYIYCYLKYKIDNNEKKGGGEPRPPHTPPTKPKKKKKKKKKKNHVIVPGEQDHGLCSFHSPTSTM